MKSNKKKKKEKTEQPNQKTNPPMIASTKNYSKRRKTDRTLGQIVKAKLYWQNHTKKHIHTHAQKEKKEKIIYVYILKKRKRATKSINKSTNDNKL